MRDHNYFVYFLVNRPDGVIYTGMTNDLIRRVAQHRAGSAGSFTKRYGCRILVWFEHHTDVLAAILREKQIKKWNRAWKVRRIVESNPLWNDLTEDLI